MEGCEHAVQIALAKDGKALMDSKTETRQDLVSRGIWRVKERNELQI